MAATLFATRGRTGTPRPTNTTFRALTLLLAGTLLGGALLNGTTAQAAGIRGHYLETRTCQVYTGPCFANAEFGLTGKDAILAWSIQKGDWQGSDLTGLNVVMVVNSTKTLGFAGLRGAGQLRSIILVDERADSSQRDALVDFARKQSGMEQVDVVRVESVPVRMSLDVSDLTGKLEAGRTVRLATRKARPTDCICSNESAYYPPLARVEQFVPGVTLEGSFNGSGLGSRWSIPDYRSSYMGTFDLDVR